MLSCTKKENGLKTGRVPEQVHTAAQVWYTIHIRLKKLTWRISEIYIIELKHPHEWFVQDAIFILNPWNSKENHFRFHPSFVRKFSLKLLNYAVSSSQSSDFRARLLLNFFTQWVKKFCSPLNVKLEFSECDKLLSGGCKWDLRTKQCKMSMWFYDEFHGFRYNKT